MRVTPDALRHIRAGHPWVFDHSVVSTSHEGIAGDLAVVFDADRQFAAIGLFDPLSPIRIKVLHHGRPIAIDRAFWAQRLDEAVGRRQPLLERGDTTGMRLVNGESDGFPGLVLDRYDRTLVMKLYTAAWAPHLGTLVSVIDERLHPEAMVVRLARNLPAGSFPGLEEGDALLGTAPDAPVLFQECGLTFEADVVHGQKTGHFLDQRDNRAFAATFAAGAKVLDVFASTGGFTVHAAAGGATDVLAVDLSAPTLAVAERNLAHNAHLPAVAGCRVKTAVGDAFREMERLHEHGRRFDLVVVDPPSFAHRRDDVERALAAYARLTDLGVRLVARGGVFVQCSCSSRIDAAAFHATVARAAAKAGRPWQEIRRTGHALDHPASFPEAHYLKAVFARLP